MRRFYIILLIIFTLASAQTAAQAQGTILQSRVSGIILDEEKQPLDFVTISLKSAGDSVLLRTAVSGLDGKFFFESLSAGTYIIQASMVGYVTVASRAFTVSESDPGRDVGVLSLLRDSKMLGEVTVVTVKPFIERKIDRLVMNVEGSSSAAGSTALEVLQKAPGVTLDQNDNISMQGKQGVMIMLDGKQTYMSSADVANMLRNMPSSQIETIELITNPSSKYDAAGNSGIINIRTKKSTGSGTNGTITVGGGRGDNYRTNAGLTLNIGIKV